MPQVLGHARRSSAENHRDLGYFLSKHHTNLGFRFTDAALSREIMNLNVSTTQTPARQRPLSLELQQVIEENNLLNTDARIKGLNIYSRFCSLVLMFVCVLVISALSEINGHQALHSSLRQRATQEILSSELSYVKQLEIIMKVTLVL